MEKPKHILIIDNDLDALLRQLELNVEPKDLLKSASPPVVVDYAHNVHDAIMLLNKGMAYDAVICDYKLQSLSGATDEWGTDFLDYIAQNRQWKRPQKLFLTSKSGFPDDQKSRLEEIGAEYFSAHELHYVAAHVAGDEAAKEACSQLAKTSDFRQFCNKQFGTQFELGVYRSPNVSEAERGRLGAAEVVARLKKGAQNHEAFAWLAPDAVSELSYTHVSADQAQALPIGRGVRGNAVAGRLAFRAEDVTELQQAHPGEPVILVLNRDYNAGDNALLAKVQGLIMLRKGTQHVSVLAQNLRLPVLFAGQKNQAHLTVNGDELIAHNADGGQRPMGKKGEMVTLDGVHLSLFAGAQKLAEQDVQSRALLDELAGRAFQSTHTKWHVADGPDATGLRVWANANNAAEVAAARALNRTSKPLVEGIGLLRSEYIDPSPEALMEAQKIAFNRQVDPAALAAFRDKQKAAFVDIFKAAGKDFPVRIRLYDFKPDEFFPPLNDDYAVSELARKLGIPARDMRVHKGSDGSAAHAALEGGHARLWREQCRAIFAAAKECGVWPQIMIPDLRNASDLEFIAHNIQQIADESGFGRNYRLGAMLESADITCARKPDTYIGSEAYRGTGHSKHQLKKMVEPDKGLLDFVSIGSNDLTASRLGLKRDDVQAVGAWNEKVRSLINPFERLAPDVRDEISETIKILHEANPQLEVSLCGRHGTDRASLEFLQDARCASVSVAPTAPAIYQANIEAGRAALLSFVHGREAVNQRLDRSAEALLASRAKAVAAPAAPTSTAKAPAAAVADVSPGSKGMAFVMIEDDDALSHGAKRLFADENLHMTGTVAEALAKTAELQKAGYKVHIFADNIVEMGNLEANHPILAFDEGDYGGKSLVLFTMAGKLPGISAADITLLTARAPKGVPDEMVVDKDMDGYTQIQRIIDKKKAEHPPAVAPVAAPAATNAFVIVEDDAYQLGKLKEVLAGEKDIHYAKNVANALRMVAAIKASGKRPMVMIDNRLPLGAMKATDPLYKQFEHAEDKGVAFTTAALNGEIDGLSFEQVALMTAGDSDGAPDGLRILSKNRHDFYNRVHRLITEARVTGSFFEPEPAASHAPPKRNVVVFADDEPKARDLMRAHFDQLFPGCELRLFNDSEEATEFAFTNADRVALMLMDENFGAGKQPGSQAVSYLQANLPQIQFGLVTSDPGMVQAPPLDGVPVYAKSELGNLHASYSGLRDRMSAALGARPVLGAYTAVRRDDGPNQLGV